jgi:hypothetical protein
VVKLVKKDKITKNHIKIKLDQGLKAFLRGLRRCLYDVFEKAGFAEGYYKWTDEKFFDNCNLFLKEIFNTKKNVSSTYTWILVTILFPKKAMCTFGN